MLSVVKWREQAPVIGAEAIAEVRFCYRLFRSGLDLFISVTGGAQEGVAEQDAEAPRAGGGGGGGGEGGAARAGKRV